MVAIYIHWPFCKSKCPYCDFNSHVRGDIDHVRWRDALTTELYDAIGAYLQTHPAARLDSVFFGGGTPSLMEPDTVAALIGAAKTMFPDPSEESTGDGDPEITMEANPTSVEAGRFRAYGEAGVNRLSLGVQSLDEDALRFLGREHSAKEAISAIELAREIFPRHSFDLIYARAGQTPNGWSRELAAALPFAGDHISLYQLTLEPGTAFMTRARQGDILTLDGDAGADLFEATQRTLDEAGYPAYEVSNHARPGGASRHNLVYWRYGDYLGIGPGAHGRVTDKYRTKHATIRHRLPEKWLTTVEALGQGLSDTHTLDAATAFEEAVMMGLRLAEGISDTRLRAETGLGLDTLDNAKLTTLTEEGLVERIDDEGDHRLVIPTAARSRLNAILGYLI